MTESNLPRCENDNAVMVPLQDPSGRKFACTVCDNILRVSDQFSEKWNAALEEVAATILETENRRWQREDAREAARQRVKAFLEARAYVTRSVTHSTMDKDVVTAAGNSDGEVVELLRADLELLVEEDE